MSKYANIDMSDEKLLQIVQEQTADADTFITVRRILNSLPKEDMEPVVHAHWIAKETLVKTITAKNYICSVCGNANYHYPYCPYCGAKMDEEVNEDA